MDNFDLKKYLAEGKLLKEDKKLFSDYLEVDQNEYDNLKDRIDTDFEGNMEDFIEEFASDFLSPNIEKINKYYGRKLSKYDEGELRTDFYNGFIPPYVDEYGLKHIFSNEKFEKWLDRNKQFYFAEGYLAEGKLLKEDSNSIVNLLMKNQREVAKKLNYMEYFPFDEVNIDLEGDASIVLQDEAGGLSFRYPEDVDSKFVGQNGDKPRPVTIGGVDLMYIGYNI